MKHFRQIVLAAFVVGAYILYSLHSRNENELASKSNPSSADGTTPSSVAPSPANPPSASSSSNYKDGSYTGTAANAFYGNIQVQAIVSGGKLTDVKFLQYPNDRRESVRINTQAMPVLRQEAISAQSASVDIVTGATDTSEAFIQSLGSALAVAK